MRFDYTIFFAQGARFERSAAKCYSEGMDFFPTLKKSLYLRISWIRWSIAAGLLANLGLWAFVWWRVEPRVEPVPFHVSVYFGIDYTAPFWYYYVFPLAGLVVTVAHACAGRLFFRSLPFLTLLLLTGSVLVQLAAWCAVLLLVRSFA
ncbi:hypothetical protein A3J43_03105 [Candidatus Uhrbacteria bacterium RIFCSPHIGHO2_12_FULL_54_23]|uniref:DUF1648 domain-containing protein n=3 Tax=Candidatus Uhriibacteriota TaxID=1752732 RepID=A0A1F7UN47_9BACT|nr:MAG: hypothetical protein A3J43_03105 [Candidatus Uhrbacteria bacterium RIFCSPHIGHO2_12_FULL_54_23]OGL85010.1 MAG: hypothetical protein A3B36_02590 [Candidatus Uhrbacteria bacterium RIFCSPLOWO2_01_FULL_55_36]OGL91098.1 MAG: hypothetical protein A3J36_02980 [Candidatus Uhrbacteria bacterium RIFCSPLOWO2_02_FULL_54_37]